MDHLAICEKAAIAGGEAVVNLIPDCVVTKGDINVGHHAIVSSGDYKSQKAILNEINKHDKKSLFVTEEHIEDEIFRDRGVKNQELNNLNDIGTYIIDELDGSSSFGIGHYEWSVSVGYVDKMEHKAGAIFAPKIEGGTLFSASRGGAFIQTGNEKRKPIKVAQRNLEDSYIIFGVDCFLTKYPVHNKLLTKLSDIARTTNSNGSCALSLGLVASGKADALIQPLQSPWDWAAGKILVEEAGGEMIFYEIENGRIKVIDALTSKHYDSERRAVGFVAGNSNITNKIIDMLLNI